MRQLKASKPAKFEEFFIRALGAGEDIRGSVCLQFLVDRFETNGRRGQLVGPHGSGKSTLTCALKEALTKRGYEIFSWSLNDRNRFLPDVFWLELQRFLQSAPAFLPVKCLLPPPVVSPEDYWEQAREAMRDLSDGETLDDDCEEKYDDVATIDEFCVVEEASEKSAKSEETNADAAPQNASEGTEKRRDGFFGFNAAGNFGFNATRRGENAPRWPAPSQKSDGDGTTEPTPFAPFPGVAPPNEPAVNVEARETPPNAAERDENDAREGQTARAEARESQKKLEIPLPTLDFQKKRSAMFDKKSRLFRRVRTTFVRKPRCCAHFLSNEPARTPLDDALAGHRDSGVVPRDAVGRDFAANP
ncbi:MAG: hypothetical protein IJO46_10475 [Thermoguttaceae bacterium]|nr:hypothetical protein [Thermoguttaceae bacterium]